MSPWKNCAASSIGYNIKVFFIAIKSEGQRGQEPGS